MQKWLRYGLTWGLPVATVALYASLWLTNGNLALFFDHTAWGSKLYANIWQHALAGNSFIDAWAAPGEYFVMGANQFVTYFGAMPALVRGIADIFLSDVYGVSLSNLSVVIALLLGLGAVWFATLRLAEGKRTALVVGASLVLAILFASPVSYLLVWAWTYHEVIMWGVAWALLFTAMFALWVLQPKRAKRWQGALMGLSVGMAMLSRPTIGLTLALPFAFLCARAMWQKFRTRHPHEFNLLWPGAVVCALLALVVMVVNYQRWGSAFTFVQIDRNVQFVELFPDRGADIREAGEFNTNRIGTSFLYYVVPTPENVKTTFPYITLDTELHGFNHTPHYDYIEGSRLPITVSMMYLFVVAGLGIYSLRRFKNAEKWGAYWLLSGAAATFVALLAVYAISLRYTAELVPAFVFLGLVYVAALQQGLVPTPGKKTWVALAAAGIVSLYITCVSTIAYKQFVWDVPPAARQSAGQFIRYQPNQGHTKHIINGERFPAY